MIPDARVQPHIWAEVTLDEKFFVYTSGTVLHADPTCPAVQKTISVTYRQLCERPRHYDLCTFCQKIVPEFKALWVRVQLHGQICAAAEAVQGFQSGAGALTLQHIVLLRHATLLQKASEYVNDICLGPALQHVHNALQNLVPTGPGPEEDAVYVWLDSRWSINPIPEPLRNLVWSSGQQIIQGAEILCVDRTVAFTAQSASERISVLADRIPEDGEAVLETANVLYEDQRYHDPAKAVSEALRAHQAVLTARTLHQ